MRRLLLKYCKEGDASFLSHREAMRALERALRRSGLPLAFSKGYNPRPRMSFSPALPLGVAAEAEYLEVALCGEVEEPGLEERLNRFMPVGLRVREVQGLAQTMPKLSRWARYGLFRLSDPKSGTTYLLLALSGEEQGRLKDALQEIEELRGIKVGYGEVTRKGLYASPEEIFEDVEGPVLFYDGGKGTLREMKGES